MSSGQSTRGIVCHICGGRGHIARVCPSPRGAPSSSSGGTGGGRPSAPANRGFAPRIPGSRFCPRGGQLWVPTNYAGYAGYEERAEQQQFDQWQLSYAPDFPSHEEGGTADYSGAMAAEYAPAEQVLLDYGPGFPHRSMPQYLPTHTLASSSSAAEICLLEADIEHTVRVISLSGGRKYNPRKVSSIFRELPSKIRPASGTSCRAVTQTTVVQGRICVDYGARRGFSRNKAGSCGIPGPGTLRSPGPCRCRHRRVASRSRGRSTATWPPCLVRRSLSDTGRVALRHH
jgi:hypothetical protein